MISDRRLLFNSFDLNSFIVQCEFHGIVIDPSHGQAVLISFVFWY